MDTFRQVPPAAAAAVTAPWLPPVCLLSISAGRASERMRRRRERGREGGREVKLDLSVLVDQDGSSYLMMQTKSNVTFRSYGGEGEWRGCPQRTSAKAHCRFPHLHGDQFSYWSNCGAAGTGTDQTHYTPHNTTGCISTPWYRRRTEHGNNGLMAEPGSSGWTRTKTPNQRADLQMNTLRQKDNDCKLPVLSKRKQLEHKGQSSPTASASVLFTGVTKELMKAQVVRKKKNNINMNQDLSWRANSCCLSPSVSHRHHHLFYVEEQPIRTQEC